MQYAYSMALAALALLAYHAANHFPWLITRAQGRAPLYFGEGLQDQTYMLPQA